MKASTLLIPTLKEAPNEAIIDSHILMLRAGLMKKLVAGVYTYLPMGLKTLNKIENIIREEMDFSGAQEILSSAIQPKELWEESGRWKKYGPELIRFKDRHNREFCLGPTHEEIFTDLIRTSVITRGQPDESACLSDNASLTRSNAAFAASALMRSWGRYTVPPSKP